MNVAYIFHERWKFLLCTLWNVVHYSVAAPMNVGPQFLQVGGGIHKGLLWSSIEDFVYSSLPYSSGKVQYTAHVDCKCLPMFPAEKYVFARLPLAKLVDLISLADARSIVALHGIAPGSRCNVAMLKSCIAEHNCSECPEYVMVFSVGKIAAMKGNEHTARYRAKIKAFATSTDQLQTLQMKPEVDAQFPLEPEVDARFPPEPASKEFELVLSGMPASIWIWKTSKK